MKIKKKLLLAPSALILANFLGCFSAAHASPLVSVGDQLDVFFTGTANMSWQSNIFADETNESEDVVLTLSPGFQFDFGRGVSNADFSVITRYDIISYDKNDDYDTETFHIKALGSYNAARLEVKGSASFDEQQSALRDTSTIARGTLSEYDDTAVNLNGEYELSPKFSFGAGVKYMDRAYSGPLSSTYADRETMTLPLDLFYELTPKVDLSVGYQYANSDVSASTSKNAYETDSHFLSVGARGDLLPKLTGSFKVGYRELKTDNSTTPDQDDSGLGLDANLTWSATPKLTHVISAARDFGSASVGARIEESSVNLRSSYAITGQWTASTSLGYSLREYMDQNRDDAYVTAGLRANYSPNQYWNFGCGYSYSDNDSDQANSSFDNHKFDLSASLRY